MFRPLCAEVNLPTCAESHPQEGTVPIAGYRRRKLGNPLNESRNAASVITRIVAPYDEQAWWERGSPLAIASRRASTEHQPVTPRILRRRPA